LLILSTVSLSFGYTRGNLIDTIADLRLNTLKSDIESVVKKHKNLAAGIALLNKNQTIWVSGVGNDKPNHPVSENTMFRTASVSKMLLAIAILKLQEEGKLKLSDKIKDIIPEIQFENPWESTYPVRIVHLLEHTSGWDEIHLVEMTHNQTPPVSLKDALEFHPHSRKSRWVPGSRMAYCNSVLTLFKSPNPIKSLIVFWGSSEVPVKDRYRYTRYFLFYPVLAIAHVFRDGIRVLRGRA
jgi:hypothetical protein